MSLRLEKMMQSVCVALVLLLATLGPTMAGTKLALVLGNGKYQNVPELGNPANDAQDLAQALRNVGFDVIEQRDATREAMAKAVHDFSDRLAGADVALFFYAGHGLQMNGENYLLPVDAKIQNAADVRFNTINLTDIQQEMESGGRTNIIILDACRNNPFADKLAQSGRSIGGRGLVRLDASSKGSLIVYSTQPNNVAFDGAGRNSPFTAALLKHVGTPGLEVRQMISRVRGDVLAATDQKQTPWDSSSLVGDVYLAGPAAESHPPAQVAATVDAKPEAAPSNDASAVPRDASTPAAEPASECEKLAAPVQPFASAEQIKAVRRARDWSHALAVCKAESDADPNSVRLRYLLGNAYFNLKDYLNAQRQFNIAADAGDAFAQLKLGYMFFTGTGVVKDYYRAVDYFTKSAAAGNAMAYSDLGAAYSNGWGVAENDAKALALFEKGIELGDPFALSEAGVMYYNGKGAPRDLAAAEQYFLQAADLADGYAMKFLAIMYERGLVGPADPVKAAQLRLRAEEEAPDSPTPQVPLPKVSAPLNHHAYTSRRIVRYRWGGGSYNPAWQAAPGDTSCCPNNMLVCPLGRHFCGH